MSIGGPGQPPGSQKPGDHQSAPVQGSPDQTEQPGGGVTPSPYMPQIPSGNGYQYPKPLDGRSSEIVAQPIPQMPGMNQSQALAQATASAYGSMDKLGGMASYWNGLGTVINNFGNINMGQAPALGVPLGCVQGGVLVPATTFPQMSLGAFNPTILMNALAVIQQQQAMLISQLAQSMSVVQSLAGQYSAMAMSMPAFQPTPMAIPLPMAFQHIHAFGTGAMPPPMMAYPCHGYQGWGAFEGQHFMMPPMPPYYFDPRWLEQHAQGAAPGDEYFRHCYKGFNSANDAYQHAPEEPQNANGGKQNPAKSQEEEKKSAAEIEEQVQQPEERPDSEQKLLQCCLTGDLEGVKSLFESGAIKDVNVLLPLKLTDGSRTQVTPLILAARSGNKSLELVKYLTGKGADSSLECADRTPLQMACWCSDDADEVIRHLANSGADIFNKDVSGNSLHYAYLSENEKNMQAVLERAGKEKERLLTEAKLQAKDFAQCHSSELKAMVGYWESQIPENAKTEHSQFTTACKRCAYEQLSKSLSALREKWSEFDINARYGNGQLSPLEMVCSSPSPDEDDFRRKLIMIHRLKQNGAVFNPAEREKYESLIQKGERDPDRRKLLLRMMSAPTGTDLQEKIRRKKERYTDDNVVPDADRVPVDPDKHPGWFAEGSEREADIEAWDKREYRMTPKTEQAQKRQDDRFEDGLESIMFAQRDDESNNVERDQAFLEAEPDSSRQKLCVPKTKGGMKGFFQKKEPDLGVGLAMVAGQGQQEPARIEDIHIEATITVDSTTYEMSTLLDCHGSDGLAIARFAKEKLPGILKEEIIKAIHEGREISDAFKLACVRLDRMLANDSRFNDSDISGTALNMVITARDGDNGVKNSWAVNLGDCETIVIDANGTAKQLSMPTSENRSIGDGILGEGKSARAKVFKIDSLGYNPDEMTLIQCTKAMREQAGPHAMAALAGKLVTGDGKNAGQCTAQEFSVALVSRAAAQRQEEKGNIVAVVKSLSSGANGKTPLPPPVRTPETVRARLKWISWDKTGQEDIQRHYEEVSSWKDVKPPSTCDDCLQELYVELQTTYGKHRLMPEGLEKAIGKQSPSGPLLIKLSKAATITELEAAAKDLSTDGTAPSVRLYRLKKARFIADKLDKPQSMEEGLKALFSLKAYASELLRDEAFDPRARLFLKDLTRSYGWLNKCVDRSESEEDDDQFREAVDADDPGGAEAKNFKDSVNYELKKTLVPFVVADKDTPFTATEIAEVANHNEVTYRLMWFQLDEWGMLPTDKDERRELWQQALSLVREPVAQRDVSSTPDETVKTAKKENDGSNVFMGTVDLDAMPSTDDEASEVPKAEADKAPIPVKTARRSKLSVADLSKRIAFFQSHQPGEVQAPRVMVDEFLEKGGGPTEKVQIGSRKVSLLTVLVENGHREAIKRLAARWPSCAEPKPVPHDILDIDQEIKGLKKKLERDNKGEVKSKEPKNESPLEMVEKLEKMKKEMVKPALERLASTPTLRTGNETEDAAMIVQMLDRLPGPTGERDICIELIKKCCEKMDTDGFLLVEKALINRGDVLLKAEVDDIEKHIGELKEKGAGKIDFNPIENALVVLQKRLSGLTDFHKHIHGTDALNIGDIKKWIQKEGVTAFYRFGSQAGGYVGTLEKLCERCTENQFKEVFQLQEVGGLTVKMDDKRYSELKQHLQGLATQSSGATYPHAKKVEQFVDNFQSTKKREALLKRFKDSDDVVTYAEMEKHFSGRHLVGHVS